MNGTLKSIEHDYGNGGFDITVHVDRLADGIEELQKKAVRIEIKPFKAKRTLTANNYYWKLLTELAVALGNSNSYQHNLMLQDWSVPLTTDMVVHVLNTPEAERKVMESKDYHLLPTSGTWGDYNIYLILKGSHEMDKTEFSRLLNGLIDECKRQGIETLTEDEVLKLRYEESIIRDSEVT